MTFSLHHYKNETWACWTASCATRIRFKTAASVIKLCFIWLIQYSFILLDASPATAWQSSCDTSNEAQSSEEYPKAYEYALSTEARRQEDKGEVTWERPEQQTDDVMDGEGGGGDIFTYTTIRSDRQTNLSWRDGGDRQRGKQEVNE